VDNYTIQGGPPSFTQEIEQSILEVKAKKEHCCCPSL